MSMFDLHAEDRSAPQSLLGRIARALNLDVPLTLGLLALCAIGLVVVYSAGGADPDLVVRQATRMAIAFAAMVVLANVPLSDRLFSLFVFVHIGVALLLVFGLWFHVQRIARPAWLPPRALRNGTAATLALLALALPFALLPVVGGINVTASARAAGDDYRTRDILLVEAAATLVAGLAGGFFESGLAGVLPLYGLAMGFGAAAAALLVSASGLGSALMMLPAGALADRLAQQPGRGGAHGARLAILHACALLTLLATLLIPLVAGAPWLAAAVAFVWGGAGGSLYTLAMIDIGSREDGITLVNSTAVLVLSYTGGAMLAPALGAAALQWSPQWGFAGVLAAVAVAALFALARR